MRFIQTPNWKPGCIHYVPNHVDIVVKCHACEAERQFDRNSLPARFEHAYIDEIQPRLKCKTCGAKGGELMFGSVEKDSDAL
ncbi:hypothetical protein ATY81_12615 [Rhizobium sp. R72]|uniref:hypothetical protein n=1 Tax=unclassified Rhizobium TaxID=2613769 RepID=UPI000B529A7B|nr:MULTISPECIES: hypothetical protein [unclassified Rhizobium]OWV94284.1 hypothetical protein ATY81_12615 [Rhizobium sp. R72]OWV94554.1 hypothetical protein ATY80_12615 [Rhizobium sp. R711]